MTGSKFYKNLDILVVMYWAKRQCTIHDIPSESRDQRIVLRIVVPYFVVGGTTDVSSKKLKSGDEEVLLIHDWFSIDSYIVG